jgi:hypothetical protein
VWVVLRWLSLRLRSSAKRKPPAPRQPWVVAAASVSEAYQRRTQTLASTPGFGGRELLWAARLEEQAVRTGDA